MRLKDIARSNLESLPEHTSPDHEVAYIDIGNVTSDGLVSRKDVLLFGAAPSRARRIVRSKNVIISTVRTYLRAIAYVEKAEENLVASTGFSVLQARQGVEPRFLYYILRSNEFIEKVVAHSEGVSYPAIAPARLDALPVWLPSPRDQASICSYLDTWTARIDDLIAKKERLFSLTTEKRVSLVCDAVTKGLNQDIPIKASGIDELGAIPEHWEIRPLRWLTQASRQIMYGIVLPGPNVEEGVPIVKGGDVSPQRLSLETLNKTTFEIESEYKRSRLSPGDIVYAIRGSIGAAALVPAELIGANITQDAARIAPRVEINPRWLLYVVQSLAFLAPMEARARGATIRGINIWDLKRGLVAVPPEQEQQEIADFLDLETAKLDALMNKVQLGIELLKEYRSALISSAVVGEIDCRTVCGI